MPYVTPKEDITLKFGRSKVTFKKGQTTLVTFAEKRAFEAHIAANQEPVAVSKEEVTTELLDDDPAVAEVMAEIEAEATPEPEPAPEPEREEAIQEAILEIRTSGDTNKITKSTGEVKLLEIKKLTGFSVTDEERDAAEAALKEQGLV